MILSDPCPSLPNQQVMKETSQLHISLNGEQTASHGIRSYVRGKIGSVTAAYISFTVYACCVT